VIRWPCVDYIAESVDAFLTEIGTDTETGEDLHLGFTFSFVPFPFLPLARVS
jgi:hexokinase